MKTFTGEPTVRCAIYTRKSTDQNLECHANSLVVQREACRALIKCNQHKNWTELKRAYDDGGYSGGNLKRPALDALLADVEGGRIDMIVVYKIDRLTRSLIDFVKLIEVLEANRVSFVSVTQSFDTSESLGRLILNILLTFAQFEREIAADRLRDKKAAMKRRGLFTGGVPPIGYLLKKGKLLVDSDVAPIVQEIFARYPNEKGRDLGRELTLRGCRTGLRVSKSGRHHGLQPFNCSTIYRILQNTIYTGYVVLNGEWIRGIHEPLVSVDQWQLVQDTRAARYPAISAPETNILVGVLHDDCGRRMHVRRSGPGLSDDTRYYATKRNAWEADHPAKRILANCDQVETLAITAVQTFLDDRRQLREATLLLGRYSDEVEALLQRGSLAARRMKKMAPAQLKNLFKALTPLIELSPQEMRLHVRCAELARFLAWNGRGYFAGVGRSDERFPDRIYTIKAPGSLICGTKRLKLPIAARRETSAEPKKWLVDLLMQAETFRSYMLKHREKSLPELAKSKKVGPTYFARVLRLNYLAPDIQTSIYDGTEPTDLTVWKLLYSPITMDWAQQRQMLGFRE